MNEFKKIHLLAQELIPVINDLEEESKQIILDHVQDCEACKNLYNTTLEFDESMPKIDYQNEVELKPLKKLVQFNTGLKLLLITVRAVILFYILYSSFNFYDEGSVDFVFLQSALILFYAPAAIFLLVFTFTFFTKKWLWISILSDSFIIVFLNKVLQLFF